MTSHIVVQIISADDMDLIWKVLCRRSFPKKQSAEAWPTQSRSRECARAQGDWDGRIYAKKGDLQSDQRVRAQELVGRSLQKVWQERMCWAKAMWMVCWHHLHEMLNLADGSRWCVHAKVSVLWRHQLLPLMERHDQRWPEFQISSQKVLDATRIFASRRKHAKARLFMIVLRKPSLLHMISITPICVDFVEASFFVAFHDFRSSKSEPGWTCSGAIQPRGLVEWVGFVWWCAWSMTHFGWKVISTRIWLAHVSDFRKEIGRFQISFYSDWCFSSFSIESFCSFW